MNTPTLHVFFALGNIASIPNTTIQALNKLPDIHAKGLSQGNHQYWTFGKHWTIITLSSFRKNPFRRLWQEVQLKTQLLKHILWADICVWYWDIDVFSFWLIKLLKKPVYVEWLGSDIRIPELVRAENKYYANCWDEGEFQYYFESRENSNRKQQKFAKLNATPLLSPEMSLFLNKEIYPFFTSLFQRIDSTKYAPIYPSKHSKKPILVHTPSATGAKGTKYVRACIQCLQEKEIPFEYIEIHNKSREESYVAIQKADIFIDQFIAGSYGIASCEAMAMGKPVLCYLMPSVVKNLPTDCAIINTSLDTLYNTLYTLISNAELRHEAGKKSRQYVEQYHDADKIAINLQKLFTERLNKHEKTN
jgi:hypothetical protein